jgi:hypothetical protein
MFRSIRTLAVLALASTALVACDDDDATGPANVAGVRVVHASPNAPNVDVLVDNTTALTNVAYRAASGFLEVDAGTRRLRVNATGTTTTVIDANVPLVAGASYTVLATGLLAGIQPVVAQDNLTDPAAGQVKLRVIHAAPAAAGVDVYATAPGADINAATPVLTNVGFRAVSDYLSVPAGTYQLRVTPTGTKTVAIDATVTLTAGQIRTVVATDAPGGGAPLAPVVLADKN